MDMWRGPACRPEFAAGQATDVGLYRGDLGASGRLMAEVFQTLPTKASPGNFWADEERNVRGARTTVDRRCGEGFWEFLHVGRNVYVAATDSICGNTRRETVPGEGHYEFFVKLSGRLHLELPNAREVEVQGPSLTFIRQSEGASIRERAAANVRETCVSVHCRPEFVHGLLPPGKPSKSSFESDLADADADPVLFRQYPLSPAIACCAMSLLNCRYEGRLRLLHHEAKVLELVCLAIDFMSAGAVRAVARPRRDVRLDRARKILESQLSEIPNIQAIARAVGISQSKLKRDFKCRFGQTMFEFALERRMSVAHDLLRLGELPIGAVATAVGYRHHTSFTAAFRRFFGFSPKAVVNR